MFHEKILPIKNLAQHDIHPSVVLLTLTLDMLTSPSTISFPIPLSEAAPLLSPLPPLEVVPPSSIPPPEEPRPSSMVPCHSTRPHNPPSHLQDYNCSLVTPLLGSIPSVPSANVHYPIQHFISYAPVSPAHHAFTIAISSDLEPKHFQQAVQNPKGHEAMEAEIKTLEQNQTWIVQPLPLSKNLIGCKWVYKIKYHSNGSIERNKARLVAKGYNQKEGLDYRETFAPIAKLVIVRCLLAIASIKH